MFVYISLCQSVRLSLYRFVCLSAYLSARVSVCLATYLSICLPGCLVRLSVCTYLCLFVYQLVTLPFYLPAMSFYLSVSVCPSTVCLICLPPYISINLSACISVRLSCLSIYLPDCLSSCLPSYLYVNLHVSPSIYRPFAYLPIFLSVYLYVGLSVRCCVNLSVYLPVCFFFDLST